MSETEETITAGQLQSMYEMQTDRCVYHIIECPNCPDNCNKLKDLLVVKFRYELRLMQAKKASE